MADFVINEWFWSDLSGSNGMPRQRETFQVIETFPRLDHRIIVLKASPFDQKAWNLCKNTNPMIVQRIAGAYVKNIRQSDRCIILTPEVLAPLPEELASAIKADDHYLVQAQRAVPGSILVTTDIPLRDVVAKTGLPCQSRDEFLHSCA